MSNSYVECLYYTIKAGDGIFFENSNPIEKKLDNFELRLEGNDLECKMIKKYTKVEDARKEVECYLKAWEKYSILKSGFKVIEFMYNRAIINTLDSSEDLNGVSKIIKKSGVFEVCGTVNIIVEKKIYLEPPQYFQLNENVEILQNRYEDYLRGKEKLPSMAYFCVTLIERDAGNRRQAAEKYKINKKVLDKLAELSSNKGDLEIDARKAKMNKGPLTEKEINWIEETVRRIIIRVGEYENNPSLDLIDMSSLPDLE